MCRKGVSENSALFAANYSATCVLPQCRKCSTATTSYLKKGWSPAYPSHP